MNKETLNKLIADLIEYSSNPGYSHGDYADTMRQAAATLAERTTYPVSQMTDEQIDAVYCEMYEYDPGVVSAPESHRNFARRILAAAAHHAQAPAAPVAEPHPDDIAVDKFAAAMKAKMAVSRAKGRGGWDDPAQCDVADLCAMLVDHVEKGDPVDVGNFAMMLFNRGVRSWELPTALAAHIAPAAQPHPVAGEKE